jgi:hypothetical protein
MFCNTINAENVLTSVLGLVDDVAQVLPVKPCQCRIAKVRTKKLDVLRSDGVVNLLNELVRFDKLALVLAVQIPEQTLQAESHYQAAAAHEE